MTTLEEIEREADSRLGPFYALTATGGQANGIVVASLRSNALTGPSLSGGPAPSPARAIGSWR